MTPKGRDLLAGQGLSTGAMSRVVVRFSDGTRVELAERTEIARVADREGAAGIGTWIELTQGAVTIDAVRQPAGRAMSIASPHGEARVLGTTLRLAVGKESTRLEVVEGRVKLSRKGGGAVDVIAGYAAVAGPNDELAARPMPRRVVETLFKADFEDGRLPKNCEAAGVEKGPDRAGNRYCAAGARNPGASCGGQVRWGDEGGKGLFAYADDLVLSVDLWVDSTVRTIDIHAWMRTQQLTFGTTLWDLPREQWVHLVIPLSDFGRPDQDRIIHPKPGELAGTFWIQAGQVGGRLYLDNVEIVRVRPGK